MPMCECLKIIEMFVIDEIFYGTNAKMGNQQPRPEQGKVQRLSRKGVG